MQFTKFPQANSILRAAPGTEHYVQDLHIFRQLPYVVSCVTLDAHELSQVVQNGQVFLQIDGEEGCSAAAYTYAFQQFAVVADFAQVAEAAPMLAEFVGANASPMLFVQPLPGHKLPADSHACAVACYQLTEEQVATVSRTGQLYFKALGTTHAPISVHAANPITFSAPIAEAPFSDVAAELGIAEKDAPSFANALTDLANQSN